MTVIPLKRPTQRKIGAKEAREIATAAGLRTTERELFMLLLRLSHGGRSVERRRAWLANELGVQEQTIRRAVRSLIARELLTVVHGSGRTWSTYAVNFAALNVELTPVPTPVHPAESATPQRGQIDPPEGSNRLPRGVKMTPQRGQNDPPLRTRDARGAGALPEIHQKDSPLPQSSDSAGTTEDASPTASGGAPSPQERCQHGRTARQGCRRCGTDSRTAEKRQRAEQARAERDALLDRQRARRDEAGVPPPPNFRDLVAQAAQAREDNSQ